MSVPVTKTCKSCGAHGEGNYCNICGQPYTSSRISLSGIIKEAFHFFTHLDKGFPYTLKELLIRPGEMERKYVEGVRQRHQRPFSMFFLCASFAALGIYWINLSLIKYFNSGDAHEGAFFHKYWVLLQVALMPFYALITWLFFKRSKYNYGEICVLMLYQFSFLFMLLTVIHLTKLIWHDYQTRYLELPLIIIYSTITNVSFFNKGSRPLVILCSVLSIALCFLLASTVQDLLVKAF